MRDGLIRRSVKRIGRVVFDTRLWLHRAQADVRYELGGRCATCGECCEAPGIQVSKATWYVPTFRRIFLWWHRHVNGFELVEAHRQDKAFVFRCTHFDLETRTCDSYGSRPGLCRDYPRVHLEQANPEFFEGCGHKAVAIHRGELIQILENERLAPDQLAKLKKGLYLEE